MRRYNVVEEHVAQGRLRPQPQRLRWGEAVGPAPEASSRLRLESVARRRYATNPAPSHATGAKWRPSLPSGEARYSWSLLTSEMP
jgi:hypothetical protein